MFIFVLTISDFIRLSGNFARNQLTCCLLKSALLCYPFIDSYARSNLMFPVAAIFILINTGELNLFDDIII